MEREDVVTGQDPGVVVQKAAEGMCFVGHLRQIILWDGMVPKAYHQAEGRAEVMCSLDEGTVLWKAEGLGDLGRFCAGSDRHSRQASMALPPPKPITTSG